MRYINEAAKSTPPPSCRRKCTTRIETPSLAPNAHPPQLLSANPAHVYEPIEPPQNTDTTMHAPPPNLAPLKTKSTPYRWKCSTKKKKSPNSATTTTPPRRHYPLSLSLLLSGRPRRQDNPNLPSRHPPEQKWPQPRPKPLPNQSHNLLDSKNNSCGEAICPPPKQKISMLARLPSIPQVTLLYTSSYGP